MIVVFVVFGFVFPLSTLTFDVFRYLLNSSFEIVQPSGAVTRLKMMSASAGVRSGGPLAT